MTGRGGIFTRARGFFSGRGRRIGLGGLLLLAAGLAIPAAGAKRAPRGGAAGGEGNEAAIPVPDSVRADSAGGKAPSLTLKDTQALMALRNDPIDTLRGEVVDITCWVAMGDSALGPRHAQCGAECLKKGLPVGVMAANRDLHLVVMHNHTSANRLLARHMGEQVTLAGIKRRRGTWKVFEITSFVKKN